MALRSRKCPYQAGMGDPEDVRDIVRNSRSFQDFEKPMRIMNVFLGLAMISLFAIYTLKIAG